MQKKTFIKMKKEGMESDEEESGNLH